MTGRTAEGGQKTVDLITAAGGKAAYVRQDVTEEKDWVTTLALAHDRHGRLDGLVNSAGFAVMKPLEAMTLDDVRFQLRINFEACFLGTKNALIAMASTGGVIVNTASVASLKGGLMSTAYAPSKAAMLSLTRAAALEGRPHGNIRVNAILPGFIWGSQVARFGEERALALRASASQRSPLGRVGEPADVAMMAVFLCSNEAVQINGAALMVDGGIHL